MTQQLHAKLNDSAIVRWSALILIALMMFFCYMFVDVLSPLANMLETSRGWTPATYGTVVGSEYFLNVFVLFLIFAGIILDKMGVRFTGLLSAGMMILGAGIKLYGISDYFVAGGFGYEFFSSFWTSFPASAKLACIGFAIFGCGAEMAGITVSKAIAKWFAGKEMALAMGLEMAIARLGVFAVFTLSPRLASIAPESVVRPVAIVGLLLCIGFLTYLVFTFMDRKLDRQLDAQGEGGSEEEFKVKDLGKLFGSPTFMIVALLCVLYYSAIFPFQKFAVPMLQNSLGMTAQDASDLFRWFPIGAMFLTPLLGAFLDFKGKGATMLILGALLMSGCHLIFALVPLTPPVAYTAIILLGVSFSLVPAALWPSVPKLVENRYLGSGYAVIFWIQNIGLWGFPIIIGAALQAANPGVSEQIQAGVEVTYNYTVPMLIFASLGVLAFFLGLWLKVLDRRKGFGLELPNVKKK
jgi:Na+/melibiose symporter-like transporter